LEGFLHLRGGIKVGMATNFYRLIDGTQPANACEFNPVTAFFTMKNTFSTCHFSGPAPRSGFPLITLFRFTAPLLRDLSEFPRFGGLLAGKVCPL